MNEIKLNACPICGRPAAAKTKPFCSVRCADVDLGRWLTGSYVVPVAEDEGEGEGDFEGHRHQADIPGHGGTS